MRLDFEICEDGNSIIVPFDDGDAGKYEFEIFPNKSDLGDGIILAADQEACLSLAKIFAQLAAGHYTDGYHLHLGRDECDPTGPGIRIVLKSSGRVDNAGSA